MYVMILISCAFCQVIEINGKPRKAQEHPVDFNLRSDHPSRVSDGSVIANSAMCHIGYECKARENLNWNLSRMGIQYPIFDR